MSSFNAQHGYPRKRMVSGTPGDDSRALMRRWALGLLLLSITPAGGCARRAYNDVYVENMAAEIRDLEDQLYEFDGEYRLMEQQLASLKSENARLKGALPAPNSNRTLRQETLPTPQEKSSSDFFVPRAGSSPTPSTPSNTKPSPAPSLDISPSSPSNQMPKSLPGAPNNAPSISPPPSLTPAPLPAPKPAPGANKPDSFNPGELAPPTIETGEPMPPSLPPIKTNPFNPLTMESDHDLELELGQINLPAQLASARIQADADEAGVPAGQIHPTSTMPSDTRIVEIRFHPTLCRAVNSDQKGDDDGMYIVLQPYNAAGEFVPLPADLVIEALDLSRDEKKALIGRWTLSTADVKAKMNPIGSSQGIHVSLSFSGPAPQCDRLLVFAYYTNADGRRLVKEHEVMLNNMHRQNAVWVPRSKSEVRPASHESPVK